METSNSVIFEESENSARDEAASLRQSSSDTSLNTSKKKKSSIKIMNLDSENSAQY